MATALDEASHDTDGLAFSTDDSDTMLLSSLIDLVGLDTSSGLDGRALVVTLLIVLIDLNGLEVVSPDGQGAVTGRLGTKVVASVLDDETKIQTAGQVDGELNVRNICSINSVQRVATDSARLRRCKERRGKTGLALVQDGVDSSGILSWDVGVVEPVVHEIIALGLVVVAKLGVLITDRSIWDCLLKGIAKEVVKYCPERIAGEVVVSRGRLALTKEAPSVDSLFLFIVELEQFDMRESKGGEVVEDPIGELRRLIKEERGLGLGRTPGDGLTGWGNSRLFDG
jgi:hypothetical protein